MANENNDYKPQRADEILNELSGNTEPERQLSKGLLVAVGITLVAAAASTVYIINNIPEQSARHATQQTIQPESQQETAYRSLCQSMVINAPDQETKEYVLDHSLPGMKDYTCRTLLEK